MIESFNGRLRDECLNQHWFADLTHARQVVEQWRADYNHVRPHGSLGNRSRVEFLREFVATTEGPSPSPSANLAVVQKMGTPSTPAQYYFSRLPRARGSLNPQGIHLSDRARLFKQTGPPLSSGATERVGGEGAGAQW